MHNRFGSNLNKAKIGIVIYIRLHLLDVFSMKKLTLIMSTCKPAKLNNGKAFFLKLSKAPAQVVSTKTVIRRKRSSEDNGTSPNCFASRAYTARISQSLKS